MLRACPEKSAFRNLREGTQGPVHIWELSARVKAGWCTQSEPVQQPAQEGLVCTHTSESATQMHVFRETVAKFLQGLGLMCTLLLHRGRSVSSPGEYYTHTYTHYTHMHAHTHPVCDSSHQTTGFPCLAVIVLTLHTKHIDQLNWAHSLVGCVPLRLRVPKQVNSCHLWNWL